SRHGGVGDRRSRRRRGDRRIFRGDRPSRHDCSVPEARNRPRILARVVSVRELTKRIFLGKSRDPLDPQGFHQLSLVPFLAWVGLGADGLSSSAYGPEEAFLALGRHTHLAVFLAAATAFTVVLISASYAQLIELFPSGGGGYLVATHLLGESAGLVSGA